MDFTKGEVSNAIFRCSRKKGHGLVAIGKNFSIRGGYMTIYPWTCIWINDDCLFSTGIKLRTSDGHSVVDQNNTLKNPNGSIFIDRHCWLGNNVSVLKNVYIAENSIIGQNTIVTKTSFTKGAIIVGIPGRIVSKDNNWNRNPPDELQDVRFKSGKFSNLIRFESELEDVI